MLTDEENLLDLLVNGLFIVDAQEKFIVWNAWLEEYSPLKKSDVMGKSFSEVFPALVGKRCHQAIQDSLTKKMSSVLSPALNRYPFPLLDLTRKNAEIKQHIYIKPLLLSDQSRACAVQIFDVSAGDRREQQLRQIALESQAAQHAAEGLAELKSKFISTVSHELRTPLTSINGALGILESGLCGRLEERGAHLLEIAIRNSKRLLTMINDLLDIEKLEAGKLELHVSNVDLLAELTQSVEANAPYASGHGVTILLVACREGLQLRCDQDRLQQILANLLSNASKFEPKGGSIEIGADERDGQIRIWVRDHGRGIPLEFQSRIFEKFTQADGSDTRQVEGTGLGLAITRELVESHGGKIRFDTGNAGTCFYVEFPVSCRP